MFPALRLAAVRLRQSQEPQAVALLKKIQYMDEGSGAWSGIEFNAFDKLVEKLQGTALAALYYGNPNRDDDHTRFRGHTAGEVPFTNVLDKVTMQNGGVWQPAYTLMGKAMPGPKDHMGRPTASPNMDCIQDDITSLQNPEASYEIHYSILRTLKHTFGPCPHRTKELLDEIAANPSRRTEIEAEVRQLSVHPKSLETVARSSIVSYLVEILETKHPATKALHKLRVMALQALLALIIQFELAADVNPDFGGAKVSRGARIPLIGVL